ncbi:expressed unknown protein [Seminavis robusta]|uniref:Uncharacterized protein n=1 Tax=Seminavis robusta TaxID=568900 RepID=A0A9N8DWL1_9STRA|nr:expressed unknown protein [Seminavis robusta]|eukprot:Sro349_g123560.1 n/a (276) ;mRNA; f:57680-58507
MIVLELIAIKGVMSLSQHLRNRQRLQEVQDVDNEKDDDDDEEQTLLTTASTLPSTKATTRGSLLVEHLERQQKDELDSLWLAADDGQSDLVSVISSSLESSLSLASSRAHCSFRPADSICFQDMEDQVLEQLDLSNRDTYDLTKRVRRGNEEEDLHVAIQAAIVARENEQQRQSTTSSQGSRRIARIPRAARTRRKGSNKNLKSFLQDRLGTMARNTKVMEGFVQERVDTFARNVETLSMAVKGECDVSVPPITAERNNDGRRKGTRSNDTGGNS